MLFFERDVFFFSLLLISLMSSRIVSPFVLAGVQMIRIVREVAAAVLTGQKISKAKTQRRVCGQVISNDWFSPSMIFSCYFEELTEKIWK